VKATRVQTVAFDAKGNCTSAFFRRLDSRFGHIRLGTLLGTPDAFFTRSVQKTEGKQAKATVLLTAASAAREINPLCA